METSLTTWFFANGSRKRVSSTSSTTVRRVSHFVSFHMVCSHVSACACHGLLCVRRPRNQDVVCHVSISRRARLAPGLLATPALVPQSSDGGILTTQILLIYVQKTPYDTQAPQQNKTAALHPEQTTHLSHSACQLTHWGRRKTKLINLHLNIMEH